MNHNESLEGHGASPGRSVGCAVRQPGRAELVVDNAFAPLILAPHLRCGADLVHTGFAMLLGPTLPTLELERGIA